MTQAKFCDIHSTENNVVPRERTMGLVLRQYDSKIKKYLELYLDGCTPCLNSKIIEVAKSHGVDVENGWTIQVLIPPNTELNKSKKWKRAKMSRDEYEEFVQKDNPSLEEQEEEEEPIAQTTRKSHKV